jgi:hypothetical protein
MCDVVVPTSPVGLDVCCCLWELGRSLEQQLIDKLDGPQSFLELTAELGLRAPTLQTLLKQQPALLALLLGDRTPNDVTAAEEGWQTSDTTDTADRDSDADEEQLLQLLAEEDPLQLVDLPEAQRRRYRELQQLGGQLGNLEDQFSTLTLQGSIPQQQVHYFAQQLHQLRHNVEHLWSGLDAGLRQDQVLRQEDQQQHQGQQQTHVTHHIEMMCNMTYIPILPEQAFHKAAERAKRAMQADRSRMACASAAYESFKGYAQELRQQDLPSATLLDTLLLHAAAGTAAALTEHMQWQSRDIQEHLNFVRDLLMTDGMPKLERFIYREQYSRQLARRNQTVETAEREGLVLMLDVSKLQPFIMWNNDLLHIDAAARKHRAVGLGPHQTLDLRSTTSSYRCTDHVDIFLSFFC